MNYLFPPIWLPAPTNGKLLITDDGRNASHSELEILATLAVIFSTHSVELATNDYASEEEVLKMDKEERRNIWKMAKMEAERKLKDELGTVITLQLRGKPIKVKVCERGRELFS